MPPSQDTILYPASYGALTQLWAGTMSETIQYNGEVSRSFDLWLQLLNDDGEIVSYSLGPARSYKGRSIRRRIGPEALGLAA